ncbi:glutamate ABC transporter substrate-binding protein [Tessaracoccus antarcticus]|uniref:Glutamate ABC transporter substrate-binding protein n=1 Tax=Tessaracoccus antarcticus TaxID=2479848 RepID=A0A3M0GCP5_9ACTN|nr:glutamate ABC transporter substrate-binding protein [Tessaracoccus antarcticus]RMB62068.1 glutamate ABC transporter substrate-binding protein [Tessaracoccus antarcticus]
MRSKTLIALLAAGTIALAGCGGTTPTESTTEPMTSDAASEPMASTDTPTFEAGTTMAKLADAGKMKVGTKFDQPGFGLKGLSGGPEGFDVEVAKIIAGAMGITADNIEWVETPSKVREEVIEQGKVDMVVATYTINDKRKERITFAGPYYVAGQQLMVAADDDSIIGPESLKEQKDKKVCSVTGSTPAENIKEYLASDSQLVLFDVYDKCADALRTGQVQAVTTDNVILLGFVSESDGKFKLVGEQFTEEPYGIGITKGDVAFCEFINTTLKDNEDAYNKAWDSTAGAVEGASPAKLPAAEPCS